jgi:hypothetical protein
LNNFRLPGRQKRALVRYNADASISTAVEGIEHELVHARNIGPAALHRLDSRDQFPLSTRLRLSDVPARSNAHRLADKIFRFVHRQDKDSGGGMNFADFRDSAQPIQLGHTDIEDYDIRFQSRTFLNGFSAILGLRHHLPAGPTLQERSQTLTHEFVVVSD